MTKQDKTQSLNAAFDKLETIIDELESSDIDLETSIPKFKKGLKLANEIKSRLSKLENQIEEISIDK